MHRFLSAAFAAAALSVASLLPAFADDSTAWIGTWTASPQPAWQADFPVPLMLQSNYFRQTIRQVARVSIGGSKVRIVISNEYGSLPLKVGAAHIAVTTDGAAIKPDTDRALTFGGESSITIPPGAPAISDPVDLTVAPLSELSVSLYFPESAPGTTIHWDGHQTAYIAAGDKTGDADLPDAAKQTQRVFLSGIMVDAAEDARAVVLFGDSITDGDGSTVDGNDRWPDTLASRLHDAGGPPVAILNQGISGAKILSDRMGVNALARFDRDVLNQARADTVVLMMGINDIGWPGSGLALHDAQPSAEQIIAGYKQLIERAHADDMRIVGATLTPFGDAFVGSPFEGYYTEEKEKIRLAVNDFIRSSGEFDGVIDFDAVVVDPAKPGHIKAEFDKGDHLHPNPAGYTAMAGAIDLKVLAAE